MMPRSFLVPLLALAAAACGGEDAGEGALSGNAAAPSVHSPRDPKPGRADAIPRAFHGVYAASPAECDRRTSSRLAVSARELRFHESVGAVRGVTVDGPRAIRVAADYRGEGQSWSEARAFRLSEDGNRLTMISDGAETGRVRCEVRPTPEPSARWGTDRRGGDSVLYFARMGKRDLTFICPAGSGDLLVNVREFRGVGSEERMTFGAGGTAVTLVADPRGDRRRGGVTGRGKLPNELAAILRGPEPVGVNYGAQNSGPYPPPPRDLAGAFVAGCRERQPARPADPPPANVSACLIQDGERLSNPPLRAVGTEPFWGARIEGRCVTYSHPEDQDGTRVWTEYTPGPGGGGTWAGALEGRRFELRARPRPGCSDGMSDKRYPLAVDLQVHGEQRRGCAEPR